MAIIKCPECQNNVSDMAASCPFCGYGVAAHVQKEKEERQAYEDFVNSHKPVSFTDQDWLLLFKVYDYALERLKTASKEIVKFRKIYFNDGVPSFPISFCNGWWYCLCDAYEDIAKTISTDLSQISNSAISANACSVASVNVGNIIRPITSRWNHFVMDPFQNNSPAILRNAEHKYNIEVAENSSMGFGVITNSVTSMALYALQASMKEAHAESKAFENKQAYINQSMSYLQQNVAKAWTDNFDKFVEDTELCHQVFMFEIGRIVFDGYLFAWKMVDDEFIKPENKSKYQKLMREIEEKKKAEATVKHKALKCKREQFISTEQALVDKAYDEQLEFNKRIEELGFALFGEKARIKKELITKRNTLVNDYSRRKKILEVTKESTNFKDYSYVFFTCNWEKLGKYECRDRTVFDVVYDENSGKYALYDSNGVKVCSEVCRLENIVGAFKQFKATYSNSITRLESDCIYSYEIFLKLTNDF